MPHAMVAGSHAIGYTPTMPCTSRRSVPPIAASTKAANSTRIMRWRSPRIIERRAITRPTASHIAICEICRSVSGPADT